MWLKHPYPTFSLKRIIDLLLREHSYRGKNIQYDFSVKKTLLSMSQYLFWLIQRVKLTKFENRYSYVSWLHLRVGCPSLMSLSRPRVIIRKSKEQTDSNSGFISWIELGIRKRKYLR